MEQLATQVCDIVREAGSRIRDIQSRGVETSTKSDRSPVTEADRRADAFLKARLQELVPAAAWLSEETADNPERLGAQRLWVVDPLDGTREFVQGLPEYSIAVALVERDEPVLGVVHNPATGDLTWAIRAGGAFHNERPARVREGNLLLTSRTETRRGEFAPFEGSWNLAPVGSIQLKLALVAAGKAAATLSRGPKHEWDVCAGSLLVAEAGGRATDMFGDRLRYNQPFPKVKGILAGAPGACERILEQLTELGPSDRMNEFSDIRTSRESP